MQAKGLVKFFGIALVLICLYQLSFTLVSNSVEKKALSYANDKIASDTFKNEDEKLNAQQKVRRKYLDSVATEQVYPILGYTYKDVKERELNLGLDLQGGMSVILEVSLVDLIKSMANDNPDPVFNKSLTDAKDLQKTSTNEDFVTLFGRAFERNDGNARLSAIFATPEYQDRIKFSSTNAEVIEVIRAEAEDAISRTFKILRARIDKFGVTQPNIVQLDAGRIQVELPGVDEPDRVRKLLQATANLEFWETYENSREIGAMLVEAQDIIKEEKGIEDKDLNIGTPEPAANDSTAVADADSTQNSLLGETTDSLSQDELRRQNPLFSIFQQAQSAGPVIGYIAKSDTADFNDYMEMPAVRSAFPDNMKLVYSAKANLDENRNPTDVYPVYAIKSRSGSIFKAPLEGDVITDARADFDYNQELVVSMNMNSTGARKWRKLTGENIGKYVAIVLDNLVYSAPVVQAEIGGGSSQISGNFTQSEADDLSNILKAGKLPAPARIVEEAVVGPSLGKASIRNGLFSLVGGLLLVLLFMVVLLLFYVRPLPYIMPYRKNIESIILEF